MSRQPTPTLSFALPRTSGWSWRLWLLGAIVLALVCLRATETYTREYETFPFVEWVEGRGPFDQAASVASARDLALTIRTALPADAREQDSGRFQTAFEAPGFFQRSIGGVRDSAKLSYALGRSSVAPDLTERVDLGVAVFHREVRARAWVDLLTAEYDFGHSPARPGMLRVTGPRGDRIVWVANPSDLRGSTGETVVTGVRGSVAYLLSLRLETTSAGSHTPIELAAHAQVRGLEIVDGWLSAW